jgi:hypothetical protein
VTWYWSEIERTLDLIGGASAAVPATEAAGASNPGRWSSKSFGYYVWSTVNVSLMLPLTLMAVGGAAALLVRWLRTRVRTDLTPELVVGGLFSYFALVWIALKDPRYALPALPYMAVLGTGWIPLLRVRWRTIAVVALCVVALVNVVGTVADSGAPTRITFPGAPKSGLGEREFTLYAPGGWIAGKPETEGAVLDVLRAAARHDSIEAVAIDPGAQQSDFNHPGVDILSRVAKIPLAIPYDPDDPGHAMILNRTPVAGDPRPCAVTSRGVAIYLSRGPTDVPFEQRRIFCPR